MEFVVLGVVILLAVGFELGLGASPPPVDWLRAYAGELEGGRCVPHVSARGTEVYEARWWNTVSLHEGALVTGRLKQRAVKVERSLFTVRSFGRGCTSHLTHLSVATRKGLSTFRLERRTFALKARALCGRRPDLVELRDPRLNSYYAASGDPALLNALLADADSERSVRQLVGNGLQHLELGPTGRLTVTFRTVGVFSRLSRVEAVERGLAALTRLADRYEAISKTVRSDPGGLPNRGGRLHQERSPSAPANAQRGY